MCFSSQGNMDAEARFGGEPDALKLVPTEVDTVSNVMGDTTCGTMGDVTGGTIPPFSRKIMY